MSTPAATASEAANGTRASTLAEFERIYREHFDLVMAFFARRSSDPQIVADLTSETFVRAIGSFGSFNPRKGSARSWLFGIARRVYARHCAETQSGRLTAAALAGRRLLDDEENEELEAKIDAQRAARKLVERCAQLPALERAAIELVDIAGLTPKEAAETVNVSQGTLRIRLFRARARLRKESIEDDQL